MTPIRLSQIVMSIIQYSDNQSEYNVEPTDQNFSLFLAYNIDQEFEIPRDEYSYRERTSIPVDPLVHNKLFTGISYNTNFLCHGFCLDDGALHSETGVNQWLEYHREYHLPQLFKKSFPLSTTIIIHGTGGEKVK